MKKLLCILLIFLVMPLAQAELPKTLTDREYGKFTTDGSGNTAIRIVLPDGGTGTECADEACNLNAATTLNSKNICLADGTNCVGTTAGGWVDGGTNVYTTATGDVVGIGTTTPGANHVLEIWRDSGTDGSTVPTINIRSTDNGTWTAQSKFSGIEFDSSDASGSAGRRAGIYGVMDGTGGDDAALTFWTTTNGNTGYQEQMRLSNAGNLGIGTLNPSNNLTLNGNMTITQYAAPSAPTLASGGAGVLTGNYKYKVACYYSGNTNRYTKASAASGTITTASEQVSVTLPTCIGSNTGWKIYRTQAGGSTYTFVANTTSSPYTDNNSDASIVNGVADPTISTQSGQIMVASTVIGNLQDSTSTNWGWGPNALVNISSGLNNTAFGTGAETYVKTSSYNTGVGYQACRGNLSDQNVSSSWNTCIGATSGNSLSSGNGRNSFLGMGAGNYATTAERSNVFGVDAYKDDIGSYMTVMGYHAGVWDGVSGAGAAVDGISQGTHSIIIGHNSISADTTPVSPATAVLTNSIFIGDNAVATVPVTNSGCIGYGCTVTTDNSFQLGGSTAFNVGIGTHNPLKRLQVQGGDVYVNNTSAKLIMKSPDGTCSSCGPDNSDVWACSSVACP